VSDQSKSDTYITPGEYRLAKEDIEINSGREKITIRVANTGDRPIQVGSHIHFVETNRQLSFDREKAIGKRLNIPAGTAVRFEPGQEKEVELTQLGGNQCVYGVSHLTDGSVLQKKQIMQKVRDLHYKGAE
jgi:urease subunit beta/urease subunit gamma/beta